MLYGFQYYCLEYYETLAYEIKLGLTSGKRKGVIVEVTVPFTEEAFMSLKDAGCYQHKSYGHEIHDLQDLKEWDHLLGKRWYLRVLSKWLYFCYEHVATVQFYLRNRQQIEEPDCDAVDKKIITKGGVLIF